MYSVYILYSQKIDRYYVGHTASVVERVKDHNDRSKILGKYTRKNGPWELVYQEDGFETRGKAMLREREIKAWKSRRRVEKLVAQSRSVVMRTWQNPARVCGINH